MRAELVGASRAKLLQVLRTSTEPLSSHDLAAAAGLHVTTARFHLEILIQSGLIETHVQRHGRGRPRQLYRATEKSIESGPDVPIGPSDVTQAQTTSIDANPADELRIPSEATTAYQDLAMLLAGHWDDAPTSRANRAQQAGRHAAAHASLPFAALTSSPNEHRATTEPQITVGQAAELISEGFADRGFSPELGQEGPTTVIRLRGCPFLAVARAHPEVVCALHLGLLQGSWERLGAPAVHASLHPFNQSDMCLARLTPTPGPTASTQATLAPTPPDNQRPRRSGSHRG